MQHSIFLTRKKRLKDVIDNFIVSNSKKIINFEKGNDFQETISNFQKMLFDDADEYEELVSNDIESLKTYFIKRKESVYSNRRASAKQINQYIIANQKLKRKMVAMKENIPESTTEKLQEKIMETSETFKYYESQLQIIKNQIKNSIFQIDQFKNSLNGIDIHKNYLSPRRAISNYLECYLQYHEKQAELHHKTKINCYIADIECFRNKTSVLKKALSEFCDEYSLNSSNEIGVEFQRKVKIESNKEIYEQLSQISPITNRADIEASARIITSYLKKSLRSRTNEMIDTLRKMQVRNFKLKNRIKRIELINQTSVFDIPDRNRLWDQMQLKIESDLHEIKLLQQQYFNYQ